MCALRVHCGNCVVLGPVLSVSIQFSVVFTENMANGISMRASKLLASNLLFSGDLLFYVVLRLRVAD